ncbi:Glycosyl transferase group 1 [Modestobacter italicus]|uniref:Glycosyl transferase group 1 n=1 Tax=Modestobacter italicus (strain DSM 44449 / CECT 9708 / BC 501) TaxID=2732864 RepID=I4EXL4_MODI5|nr:glycosyltransferase family 4 protein [Modestobacter marinus]CCH88127.1 Glycosyl transferase group 1 [Modestobacter marinus]
MTAAPLVVAASYGPTGASTRVRVLDWMRFLGLEPVVSTYLGTSNVRPGTLARRPLGVLRAETRLQGLRRGPAPERLLVSRSMGPFTGGRLESSLLRRAGWGVYDFDDALYADRRAGLHRFLGQSAVWARAVAAADLVIAGNVHLAEAAAERNPDVTVIPSCVDPTAYPQKQEYAVGAVPRLVWLGSPSTEGYLASVAPALLQVHRSTGARLLVISAGNRPLGDLDAMVDRVTWAGPRTDALLVEADCGIMPLPDTPFTRGKCAYKLLQYGAAGLPVCASPVGVNAQVVDQLGGCAATDHGAWVDALTGLLTEPAADRRARGRGARRAVEEHYSFGAWRQPFLDALRLPGGVGDPLR